MTAADFARDHLRLMTKADLAELWERDEATITDEELEQAHADARRFFVRGAG